jgi:hypothetical protein
LPPLARFGKRAVFESSARTERKCSYEGSKRKNKRRRSRSPFIYETEQQQEQKKKDDKKRKEITKPNHITEWIQEWLAMITQLLDGTGGHAEPPSKMT